MTFLRATNRRLDDEHRENLDLFGRLEAAFARVPRGQAAGDPDLARLLGTLARALEHDIAHHFEFEERELFPRLDAGGGGDLAALLAEEHASIRSVAAGLLPRARSAGAGTLDAEGWQALQRSVHEFVERMISHIDKETLALLPMLDDLLDEETDSELAFAYAGG